MPVTQAEMRRKVAAVDKLLHWEKMMDCLQLLLLLLPWPILFMLAQQQQQNLLITYFVDIMANSMQIVHSLTE